MKYDEADSRSVPRERYHYTTTMLRTISLKQAKIFHFVQNWVSINFLNKRSAQSGKIFKTLLSKTRSDKLLVKPI